MTFNKFKDIVINKYPNAEIFPHGKFAGNKINVTIIFNSNGKAYSYNGTYCDVLNKLRIKAIYKHNVDSLEKTLNKLVKEHNTKNLFFNDFIFDHSEKIKECKARLRDIQENYIIV